MTISHLINQFFSQHIQERGAHIAMCGALTHGLLVDSDETSRKWHYFVVQMIIWGHRTSNCDDATRSKWTHWWTTQPLNINNQPWGLPSRLLSKKQKYGHQAFNSARKELDRLALLCMTDSFMLLLIMTMTVGITEKLKMNHSLSAIINSIWHRFKMMDAKQLYSTRHIIVLSTT